jgi:hypothetical protein
MGTMTTTVQRFTLHDAPLIAEHFLEEGWALIDGVFDTNEMATIKAATERCRNRCRREGAGRSGNVARWVEDSGEVRGMQWPAHWEPELAELRCDERYFTILEPILGPDIKQIINQLHWKIPGGRVAVQFHRDRRSRTPAHDFRDLAASWVQTGLAVDAMTAENGPLLVVPRSHHRQVDLAGGGSNFTQADIADRRVLAGEGFTEADVLPVHCPPGSIALWHVDTIHGSDRSRSSTDDRCLYINGFVKAQNCLRGQWAFIGGQPIPLPPADVPVLVQWDGVVEEFRNEAEPPMVKAWNS